MIELFDEKKGSPILSFNSNAPINSIAISPSGRFCSTFNEAGIIEVNENEEAKIKIRY